MNDEVHPLLAVPVTALPQDLQALLTGTGGEGNVTFVPHGSAAGFRLSALICWLLAGALALVAGLTIQRIVVGASADGQFEGIGSAATLLASLAAGMAGRHYGRQARCFDDGTWPFGFYLLPDALFDYRRDGCDWFPRSCVIEFSSHQTIGGKHRRTVPTLSYRDAQGEIRAKSLGSDYAMRWDALLRILRQWLAAGPPRERGPETRPGPSA